MVVGPIGSLFTFTFTLGWAFGYFGRCFICKSGFTEINHNISIVLKSAYNWTTQLLQSINLTPLWNNPTKKIEIWNPNLDKESIVRGWSCCLVDGAAGEGETLERKRRRLDRRAADEERERQRAESADGRHWERRLGLKFEVTSC